MSDPVVHPGAGWCDVCAVPDGYAFVYVDGTAVVCDINGLRAWRVVGSEPFLFLDCDYVDGLVVAIGKGGATGQALVTVGGSAVRSAGMTAGNSPVAVSGNRLYICRTPTEYEVLSIAGESLDTRPMPLTSQGFRDVTPDGEIRFADAWFSRVRGGLKLLKPVERGALMIGQSDRAEQINGVLQVGTDAHGQPVYETSTPLVGFGDDPHVAQLGAGLYAICARTPQGAALTVVPPYPPLVVNQPPPPPPPPPEDPVPDVPDYFTLAQSAIDAGTLAQLDALNDRAEAIRAAKGEDHPDTQAAEHDVNQLKGACNERIQRAVNAHEGRQDWGGFRKEAGQHWTRSDGTNLSTDITFNKRLLRFVDAMGDRRPSWSVLPANDPNINPEKWVAPLASEPPPIDPPDDPDPVDLGPILARLDRLELRVTALETPHESPHPVDLKPLEERVAILERKRYRVSGKTATSFAHQHTIGLDVEEIKP